MAGVLAAVGVDLLVETDEERVSEVLDGLRAAAEAGDLGRAMPLLDIDGDGFELVVEGSRERYVSTNLDALEERIAEGAEWLAGADIRFEAPVVRMEGKRAHAYVRMLVARGRSGAAALLLDVTLRRGPDGWLVGRLRGVPSGPRRTAGR